MQADQFPIRDHLFAGDIASSRLPTQQHSGDGPRVKPIGLRTQALTLVKLMGLPRMQQTQDITALLQFVVEILMVA